ncbi:ketopantoate reductase family protein [Chloroflexota bacterium]
MEPRIAVISPGGVGGPLGGLLTRAGHDVVLIDQWPAHVEAMKAHGLRVTIGSRTDPEAEYVVPVRVYHPYEVCTLQQQFDIIFLVCKSYDTCWLVQLIEPYLKPDGVLVSVQNSLNDEWIVPIIGYNRDIGCIIQGGGLILEPGHVWRPRSLKNPTHAILRVGELHGRITPRLEKVASIMGDAGKTDVTTNIWGGRWLKLVFNCACSALAALVSKDKSSGELIDVPDYLPICAELAREVLEVGAALGYGIEPVFGLTAEELLDCSPVELAEKLIGSNSRGSLSRSGAGGSMVQYDIQNGRPSEVGGYLNGLIVRKGQQARVPTPVNEAVTNLVLQLERGELQQDVSNLELVQLDKLGQTVKPEVSLHGYG